MFVSCGDVCCQVEVCDELIVRPEESYRLWCVIRNLVNEEAIAHWGLSRQRKKVTIIKCSLTAHVRLYAMKLLIISGN